MSAAKGDYFNPVRRTIKNNNVFLVNDDNGNILSGNTSGYGLYTDDTRFLSHLELKINDSDVIVLSSSTETGYSSVIIGTNTLISDNLEHSKEIAPETIQIKRERIIYGSFFENLTITNYNSIPVGIKIDLFFDADFLDIFEVRNIIPLAKTIKCLPVFENHILNYTYHDVTGAILATEIKFSSTQPDIVKDGNVTFEFQLEPYKEKKIEYQINLKSTASLPEMIKASDFEEAFLSYSNERQKRSQQMTLFSSKNEDFNELLQRSFKDVKMLTTRAYYGEYIAAGIPWYTTLFGRDSLITARQTLMLNPDLAKNVLFTLAKFQGKTNDPWRDEEPGKIPHEIRFGELARSNAVPHSPYYGSVDATALWIILFYDYFKWTNDIETLEILWKTACKCMEWIDSNLSITGYASYKKLSIKGLDNQGWKDSFNSNLHADGSLAPAPVSLVEAQGYTYAAKICMAQLAEHFNDNSLKINLLTSANALKKRFNEDFWMKDLKFYAMGLDGNGNPMEVITSNPGHCIETGILNPDYLKYVVDRLFEKDMFSGWGIRTLSEKSTAYNPMSYHNGSIWPHDNSLIAFGLAKIGKIDLTLKITSGLFEAARLLSYKRLPELFCGFPRDTKRQDPPVMYPTACSPQAWSAASTYMLIQAMLNITPDAQKNEFLINNPQIPYWLNHLKIDNIKIGSSSFDLEFIRINDGLVTNVLNKRGHVELIIRK